MYICSTKLKTMKKDIRRDRKFWVVGLLTHRRVDTIVRFCITHDMKYRFDKGFIHIEPKINQSVIKNNQS